MLKKLGKLRIQQKGNFSLCFGITNTYIHNVQRNTWNQHGYRKFTQQQHRMSSRVSRFCTAWRGESSQP